MRFAAVIRHKSSSPMPAPKTIRQPVPDEMTSGRPARVRPSPRKMPVDLDQRVRLVGEW